MELELSARQVPFEPQKELCIYYKGRCLEKRYIADLVCFGTVLVELKSIKEIGHIEEAQMLNYLKATGLRVGLIINFSDPGDWTGNGWFADFSLRGPSCPSWFKRICFCP